jgi:hypothetical protein
MFRKGPWDPYVRILWTGFLKSAPPELTQKGAVIVLNRHAPVLCKREVMMSFWQDLSSVFIPWIVFMVSCP